MVVQHTAQTHNINATSRRNHTCGGGGGGASAAMAALVTVKDPMRPAKAAEGSFWISS